MRRRRQSELGVGPAPLQFKSKVNLDSIHVNGPAASRPWRPTLRLPHALV